MVTRLLGKGAVFENYSSREPNLFFCLISFPRDKVRGVKLPKLQRIKHSMCLKLNQIDYMKVRFELNCVSLALKKKKYKFGMGQKLSSEKFEKRWCEYAENKFDFLGDIRLPTETCLLICQKICLDLQEKKEVELKDLEKIAFKGEIDKPVLKRFLATKIEAKQKLSESLVLKIEDQEFFSCGELVRVKDGPEYGICVRFP